MSMEKIQMEIGKEKDLNNPTVEMLPQTAEGEINNHGGITEEKAKQIQEEYNKKIAEKNQKAEADEQKAKGLFGKISSFFSESEEKKESKWYDENINKVVKTWVRAGKIETPTKTEVEVVVQAAKAEKWKGKVGVNEKNEIVYRPESAIGWGSPDSGAAGH